MFSEGALQLSYVCDSQLLGIAASYIVTHGSRAELFWTVQNLICV